LSLTYLPEIRTFARADRRDSFGLSKDGCMKSIPQQSARTFNRIGCHVNFQWLNLTV
jgi:hypothetical protein